VCWEVPKPARIPYGPGKNQRSRITSALCNAPTPTFRNGPTALCSPFPHGCAAAKARCAPLRRGVCWSPAHRTQLLSGLDPASLQSITPDREVEMFAAGLGHCAGLQQLDPGWVTAVGSTLPLQPSSAAAVSLSPKGAAQSMGWLLALRPCKTAHRVRNAFDFLDMPRSFAQRALSGSGTAPVPHVAYTHTKNHSVHAPRPPLQPPRVFGRLFP